MLIAYSIFGLVVSALAISIPIYACCKRKRGIIDKLLDNTEPYRRLSSEESIIETLEIYIKDLYFKEGISNFQFHSNIQSCVSGMILILLNKKIKTSDKFLHLGYTNKVKVVFYNYIRLYPEIMTIEVIQSLCASIIYELKGVEEDSFHIFKELVKIFKKDLAVLYFLESAIESMYQKELTSPEISTNFIHQTNLNLNSFRFDEEECKRYYSVFKSRV